MGLMVDGSGAWFKFKFANAVITFYLATGGVRLRSCAGICSLQCRQGCTELGALFCRSPLGFGLRICGLRTQGLEGQVLRMGLPRRRPHHVQQVCSVNRLLPKGLVIEGFV